MAKEKQEAFETFAVDLPPIRGFPELRWAGKRPFRSTQYFPAQKKESYGDATAGWWNRLYWGDNLQVMSHLLREFRGKVKLAYIDPPFDSKAEYKKSISLAGATASNDSSSFEEKQYSDIWSSDQYLQFIYERACLIRELLADDGVIFLHCDHHQSHRIRSILDEVFGPDQVLNEIVWVRSTNPKGSQHIPRNLSVFVDSILCYGKSSESKLQAERIRVPLTPEELVEKYYRTDDKGRYYDGPIVSTAGMGDRPNLVYEYGGYTPPSSGWRVNRETLKSIDEAGDLGWTSNGKPFRKLRLEADRGRPIGNFWNDISLINSQSNERVGYPTQKPEQLLSRIVSLASDPGDLVLDCFMGSGTTQAVAYKLGRRYIGADINLGAIETAVKRLNELRSSYPKSQLRLPGLEGSDDRVPLYSGFEIFNVNNYDLFRNPVEARELVRDAMELQPLGVGSLFDGERDGYLVKIMPVNRVATRSDLNEIISGLDFKAFERRQVSAPNKPVEKIHLVCMGHEPDLAAELQKAAKPFDLDVLVTDLIRDKSHLHFKRATEAKLVVEGAELLIAGFYPMNLLQKLSTAADAIDDWRRLVESVKIDWNYDGAVLTPAIVDSLEQDRLVVGRYRIPTDAATIRVKITDLLSESWEGEIKNG